MHVVPRGRAPGLLAVVCAVHRLPSPKGNPAEVRPGGVLLHRLWGALPVVSAEKVFDTWVTCLGFFGLRVGFLDSSAFRTLFIQVQPTILGHTATA